MTIAKKKDFMPSVFIGMTHDEMSAKLWDLSEEIEDLQKERRDLIEAIERHEVNTENQ